MCYRLVNSPNLPNSRVKHCLIGGKYINEISELEDLGINCLLLSENQFLEDEINNHADILCCNTGNGVIILNDNSIGESYLKEIGYKPVFINDIKSPYPYDIPLNCAVINNNYICNEKFTHSLVKKIISDNNCTLISSKQGYCRCNLCIVNCNAVITEDKGLACLLKNYQFDVLEISSGDVFLSDNHYGFLGGASGKISSNEMYFSGDLTAHTDYQRIFEFLNKYNVKPIFTKTRKLKDFGGFIQLTEVL